MKVNLRFEDLPTELTLVTKEGESKLPVRRDANGAFVNLPPSAFTPVWCFKGAYSS